MEKTLYECSFYLKDEKGNKKTEYLTTYFETEYSHYAENLLIATFANGNRDRIWFSSPQTVRDKDTLLKKDMVYVLFQFQLGNENGNRMSTTFNYFFTDIIMARDIHKAEMLLNAKYGQGNPKRILSRTSRTYRYDELRSIPSEYETYEFTFYLKDEKGKKSSEMMTMRVDDNSYWKAEEKLIAMLANGDKDRVWHSSGKTIGPSLPTALRKQYEEEQEKKRLQKEREEAEERAHRLEAQRKVREEERNRRAEGLMKARDALSSPKTASGTSKKSSNKSHLENLPEPTKEEMEAFEIWYKGEEERQAKEREEEQIRKANKEAEETKARYPFQNFLIFIISVFCAGLFITITNISKDDRVIFGSAAIYTILLFIIRKRMKWRRWFPVKISLILLVGYVLFEFVRVVLL